MPYASTPALLFPTSYATSGTSPNDALTIRRTDLGSNLDATEIAAATGDPRKIIAGFIERFTIWYNALANAGNAPSKITVKKVAKLDSLTNESVLVYTFTVRTPATIGNDLVAES
jgi:hypothetical protein